MKIAVLGSGTVGTTLAKGFQDAGHEVRIGSRDGRRLGDFTKTTSIVEGRFIDVAAFGEVVVLSVKGEAAEGLTRELAPALAGKVVIDTNNPIAGAPKDGVVQFFTTGQDSLIERLQRAAPKARVVKAFNSVGAALMVKPRFPSGTPAMFICGDDAAAKATVTTLLSQLGWAAEDVGTSAAGHPVEALCQLWCAPGFLRNDWAHALAVLRP